MHLLSDPVKHGNAMRYHLLNFSFSLSPPHFWREQVESGEMTAPVELCKYFWFDLCTGALSLGYGGRASEPERHLGTWGNEVF